MIAHMLKSWFKTFNSKQKTQKAQKDKKLVSQKNRNGYKTQTYINPFKQNNDHTRIICKIGFCSSFNKALSFSKKKRKKADLFAN